MFHETPRLSRRQMLAAGLGLSCASFEALAQEWPSKSLSFVVPFPAGGSNDIVARLVAEGVGKRLGQTVVIENRSGASGALGAEAVLRAPKDQHTFLVASDSVSLLPLFRPTPWDLTKTFVPIAALSFQPIVLVTAPSTGLKSIRELQAQAKAKPNQLSYATSGQGSIQHLVGELFSQQLGIDLLHVPYRGGGQAVNDVLAGQVAMGVLGAAAVAPHIKSGKLVALAVTTAKRSALMPDVPTLAESGASDFDVPQWSALFALESTSPAVLAKLRQAVESTLAEPDVKQRLVNAAMENSAVSPDAFHKRMIQDRDRWARLIKDRKISLE